MILFFSLWISILLTACSAQKEWVYHEVPAHANQFHSTMLKCCSDNELIGISVELLKGSFGVLGYLHVHARQIPSTPQSPHQAIVVFVIKAEKFPYLAERMQGGQTLLLPNSATQHLIDSLINHQPITICLEGYMTCLEPSNFKLMLKKFNS